MFDFIKDFFNPLTNLKAVGIIVLFGFIVYANSMFNSFVWDDLALFSISEYRSASNVSYFFIDHSMSFYRPIPVTILATLYTLFGTATFAYHMLALSIHIMNTILVFLLFRKFLAKLIAFFLSIIFLTHPMNIEAVAYISSIINPLFLFFGLSALFLVSNKKLGYLVKYSLISILLLLAILTKEAGFIFMILIPFYMTFNIDFKFVKKDYIILLVSYVFALIPYTFLRFFVTNVVSVENDYSPVPIMQASIFERTITLPKTIYYYIHTFIYPKTLAISQNWLVKEINLNDFFIPLAVVIVFFFTLGLGFVYLLKKKSKLLKTYLFFTFWFLISWGIHWNIIPLDMTVADRWLYLAMIGLLGMIGVFVNEIKAKNKNINKIVVLTSIVFIVFLSVRTIVRNQDWKDPLTLYLNDVKYSKDSYDLELLIANELLNMSKYDEAKPHLLKSIELAPRFWGNWNSLGFYYEKIGDIDNAIDAYSTSIENNPGSNISYGYLADIYVNNKDPKEARGFLNKTLSKHPSDPYFILLSGVIDYRLGNKSKGIEQVLKAYSLRKDQDYLFILNKMQNDEKI